MKIILASQSPRRIEMLKDLGFEFDVIPSDKPENVIKYSSNSDFVRKLAKNKAMDIYKDHKDALVLGFDTLVFLDGERLGKPHSKEECIDMIKKLSGRTHEVITGAYIVAKDYKKSFSSKCSVEFYDIPLDDILKYADSKEPYDKAGAYAIQGYIGRYIKKITGDYFSIVGMPKALVYQYVSEYLRNK